MPKPPWRSPYYTDQGPEDGPILTGDEKVSHQLDVFDDDGPEWPIGTAIVHGRMAGPWGEVATYRIRIGRDDKPGLCVVDRRRFVPTAAWATD